MAKKTKKTWKEMSPAARASFVAIGIAQVSLMIAAQRDISKRPAEQINGPKAAWRMAVNDQLHRADGLLRFGAQTARSKSRRTSRGTPGRTSRGQGPWSRHPA